VGVPPEDKAVPSNHLHSGQRFSVTSRTATTIRVMGTDLELGTAAPKLRLRQGRRVAGQPYEGCREIARTVPVTVGHTSVTAIASGPTLVTAPGHGFQTGDVVRLNAAGGLTDDALKNLVVEVIDSNRFKVTSSTANAAGPDLVAGDLAITTATRIRPVEVAEIDAGHTISAVTTGNPTTITVTGHKFSTKDKVHLLGIAGLSTGHLNALNAEHEITRLDDNKFTVAVTTSGTATVTSARAVRVSGGLDFVISATAIGHDDPGHLTACVAMDGDFYGGAVFDVGTVAVTRRVDLEKTFTFSPLVPGTIQIEGRDLNFRTDRILIINGNQTCGNAEPSPYLIQPPAGEPDDCEHCYKTLSCSSTAQPIDRFNAFQAAPPSTARRLESCGDDRRLASGFEAHSDRRCMGGVLPHLDYEHLRPHACHDGSALCVSEQTCLELCDLTAGCVGADFDGIAKQCLLHSQGFCEIQAAEGRLLLAANTTFFARREDHERALSCAEPLTTSLTFGPVEFSEGGFFKLCFCDPNLLPNGQHHCESPADYAIEVGAVQSTGVQCML